MKGYFLTLKPIQKEVKIELLVFFPTQESYNLFYSCLASGDFCRLLITFANNLDPDHDQRNVGPDLDPNRLTL